MSAIDSDSDGWQSEPAFDTAHRDEVPWLDLPKCRFEFLQRSFDRFSVAEHESLDGLLIHVRRSTVSIAEAAHLPDHRLGLSGWLYWYFFLTGYADAQERDRVSSGNVFVRYMRESFRDTRFDPELDHILADDERLTERVSLRYASLRRMNDKQTWTEEPVRVFDPESSNASFVLRQVGDERPFSCSGLDGYHRIFCAMALGLPEAPFIVSQT